MKHLLLTAALTLPMQATAGGLIYEPPAEPALAAAPMGDQADWIVPLVLLGLIVLAINNSDGDEPPPSECETDCEPPPNDCITKSCVLTDIYGDDNWWAYDPADKQLVRDFWAESGRAEGIDDWSAFYGWVGQ